MNIETLYEMQKALDERIIREKGLEGQDLLPNTVLALQVEIGELANEWRGFKHWSNDREPRRKRMLEEYVDCLHFFLSIAVKNDWKDDLHVWREAIEDVQEKGLDGGVMGAFLEVYYWLSKMHMEKDDKRLRPVTKAVGLTHNQYCFRNAWFVFVCLGIVGFGFTLEQIASAYAEKNRVNHERQKNGY